MPDTPCPCFASPARFSSRKKNVLVVIPAWNEQASVAEVILQIREHPDCDVVVVDDASTDGTAAVAKNSGARVLSLPVNLGAWGAIQTGLRYAHSKGYHTVITMDADGQHKASSIPSLLAPLMSYQADVTIGSCTPRGSRPRKLVWLLFRWITGLGVKDLTSGLRAYSSPAITLLASSRATLLDYQDVGVLLLLRKAGLRIHEVQVEMCPRVSGSSKVFASWLKVSEYMLLTMILCLSQCLRRSRKQEESE